MNGLELLIEDLIKLLQDHQLLRPLIKSEFYSDLSTYR